MQSVYERALKDGVQPTRFMVECFMENCLYFKDVDGAKKWIKETADRKINIDPKLEDLINKMTNKS